MASSTPPKSALASLSVNACKRSGTIDYVFKSVEVSVYAPLPGRYQFYLALGSILFYPVKELAPGAQFHDNVHMKLVVEYFLQLDNMRMG